MGNCNCENNEVVPDYTKVGFSQPQKTLASADADSVDQLHQQLAADGIMAVNISACASAKYSNGQICFNFPLLGQKCFKAPINIPANATLKICGDVCTNSWHIPKGLKGTLYVNDNSVWTGTIWGSC